MERNYTVIRAYPEDAPVVFPGERHPGQPYLQGRVRYVRLDTQKGPVEIPAHYLVSGIYAVPQSWWQKLTSRWTWHTSIFIGLAALTVGLMIWNMVSERREIAA